MINIVEDINTVQNILFKCNSNVNLIYDRCLKGPMNTYELLKMYGVNKKNKSLYLCISYRLSDLLEQYAKRLEVFESLVGLLMPGEQKTPTHFVTDNEIIDFKIDDFSLTQLLEIFDEKLIDYDSYHKILDHERIQAASKNICDLSSQADVIIKKQLKDIENNNSLDFDDDNGYKKFANYALLDAFKKQSIKECTYLPEDIRIQIIKLLQQGLNKYDSTDLYELFDLAEQKLITLAEETKIINAQRKLRKKEDLD